MAPCGLPGGSWAKTLLLERARRPLEAALGGLRGRNKFLDRARGRPSGNLESVNIDQGPPWGRFWPPFGGARGASERTFGALFRNL